MKKSAGSFSKWATGFISVWIIYVFAGSLPYKFSNAPDTQHIFGTIGQWMSDVISLRLGLIFTDYGALVIGTFELVTVILLLLGLIGMIRKKTGLTTLFQIAGLLSSALMFGAVFFHLFTPLGIAVLHNGVNDGGSLFISAVSVLVLGIILFFINDGILRVRGFIQTITKGK